MQSSEIATHLSRDRNYKNKGLLTIIRVAKLPHLFLFLLQSLFPLKCLCVLTFLVSFTN